MLHVIKKTTLKSSVLQDSSYICLGSKHKGEYILKETIVYIEAYENYSWFHLENGSKRLGSKSVGYYENELSADGFVRIHRSYVINLSYLRLYEQKYRLVHLKGELVLSVSHRKNRNLPKIIKNTIEKANYKVAI